MPPPRVFGCGVRRIAADVAGPAFCGGIAACATDLDHSSAVPLHRQPEPPRAWRRGSRARSSRILAQPPFDETRPAGLCGPRPGLCSGWERVFPEARAAHALGPPVNGQGCLVSRAHIGQVGWLVPARNVDEARIQPCRPTALDQPHGPGVVCRGGHAFYKSPKAPIDAYYTLNGRKATKSAATGGGGTCRSMSPLFVAAHMHTPDLKIFCRSAQGWRVVKLSHRVAIPTSPCGRPHRHPPLATIIPYYSAPRRRSCPPPPFREPAVAPTATGDWGPGYRGPDGSVWTVRSNQPKPLQN